MSLKKLTTTKITPIRTEKPGAPHVKRHGTPRVSVLGRVFLNTGCLAPLSTSRSEITQSAVNLKSECWGNILNGDRIKEPFWHAGPKSSAPGAGKKSS